MMFLPRTVETANNEAQVRAEISPRGDAAPPWERERFSHATPAKATTIPSTLACVARSCLLATAMSSTTNGVTAMISDECPTLVYLSAIE